MFTETQKRHQLWNRLKNLSRPHKPTISYFNSATNIRAEINRLLNHKLTNKFEFQKTIPKMPNQHFKRTIPIQNRQDYYNKIKNETNKIKKYLNPKSNNSNIEKLNLIDPSNYKQHNNLTHIHKLSKSDSMAYVRSFKKNANTHSEPKESYADKMDRLEREEMTKQVNNRKSRQPNIIDKYHEFIVGNFPKKTIGRYLALQNQGLLDEDNLYDFLKSLMNKKNKELIDQFFKENELK